MINCFGVPLSLLGRCHGEREGGESRGGIEDRLVDCIPELLVMICTCQILVHMSRGAAWSFCVFLFNGC